MNKHTPGPWKINLESSDCGVNKLSIEAEDEYFIAQVDEGMFQEANACLISAAPDLLEALKEAVKEYEGLPHSLGYEFTHLSKMRDAIAKAQGGAK